MSPPATRDAGGSGLSGEIGFGKPVGGWRLRAYTIIFEADTRAGWLFDVRILRLLRIFRIFKLVAYVGEFRALGAALVASRRKILIFLSATATLRRRRTSAA